MRKLLLAALCCAAFCVPASAAARQPRPVTPAQKMVERSTQLHLRLQRHFLARPVRPARPNWLDRLLPVERTF